MSKLKTALEKVKANVFIGAIPLIILGVVGRVLLKKGTTDFTADTNNECTFAGMVQSALASHGINANDCRELTSWLKNTKNLTFENIEGLQAVPVDEVRRSGFLWIYRNFPIMQETWKKDSVVATRKISRLLKERHAYADLTVKEYLKFMSDTAYYPQQIIVTGMNQFPPKPVDKPVSTQP